MAGGGVGGGRLIMMTHHMTDKLPANLPGQRGKNTPLVNAVMVIICPHWGTT